MKNVMKDLLILQKLELQETIASSKEEEQLKLLREKVPESILGVFDRWIGRGKKAVAVVRDGVCCECHLKVAIGVLGNLAHGGQIERCGNCGRMLSLPQEEDWLGQPLRSSVELAPSRNKLSARCQNRYKEKHPFRPIARLAG